MHSMPLHKLTSEAITWDFSRQQAFLDNPDLTIVSLDVLAAEDENGKDVSAEVFDSGKPNQVEDRVVRAWVHEPPAGVIKTTVAVICSDGQRVVWQDPDGGAPQFDVSDWGPDPD